MQGSNGDTGWYSIIDSICQKLQKTNIQRARNGRIHSKNYVEYKVKAFPEDELWWVLSHDYYVPLLEKNMELSEPSLIREMLYQETVFDSLRYKPEEVLEKILGVMK